MSMTERKYLITLQAALGMVNNGGKPVKFKDPEMQECYEDTIKDAQETKERFIKKFGEKEGLKRFKNLEWTVPHSYDDTENDDDDGDYFE